MSYIQHNTRIPVMGHADGICHIYIDAAADIDAACAVVRAGSSSKQSACMISIMLFAEACVSEELPE